MAEKQIDINVLLPELGERGLKVVIAEVVENFLDKADEVSELCWPEFMLHDVVANRYWEKLNIKHASFQYAVVDSKTAEWIAVGNSIPVYWPETIEALPDEGWDWALKTGMEATQPANLLCALAIQIHPDHRGQGLSSLMVKIMKEIGRFHGLDALMAPVRPNKKPEYPLLSMDEYIQWKQDGKHFDPWLRTHERLGAKTIKVCSKAMHIKGHIQAWQEWTGMTFQSSGQYIIPGALTNIDIDIEKDQGVYVEPNVWMLHEF